MGYKTASPDRYEMLRSFARENRRNMTLAESVLWENIRNGNLEHKFLRQHVIGDYIVDFLCRDKRLIIEVDGGYHAEREQHESDEVRASWLESQGYSVIRFSNEQILHDIDNVLNEIKRNLT